MQKRMLFVGRELGYDGRGANALSSQSVQLRILARHLRGCTSRTFATQCTPSCLQPSACCRADPKVRGSRTSMVTGAARPFLLTQQSDGLPAQPGGCLAQWDNLPQQWSWSNVMTRYHEAYHDKMRSASAGQDESGKAANIHEYLRVKDADALTALQFDDHTRLSFLDHLGATPETTANAAADTTRYEASISETSACFERPGIISKTFALT